MSESATGTEADHVVVEFDASADEAWVADALAERPYVGYLRRVHAGSVAPGDEWDEFVSRGCGGTRDVSLAVAAVEGGDAVGPTTTFTFRPADR